MENLKHTREYAEKMRLKAVDNFETTTFADGYMKAIEETAAPDMLEALIEVVNESNRGVSGRLIIDRRLEKKILTLINKATK